jgi:excisionase family DNA binding protein
MSIGLFMPKPKKPSPRSDTISIKEAAQRLGVDEDTVRNWMKRGWLKGFKLSPGRTSRVRVYVESIEEFERNRPSY